jgi:hypothetical protein
VNKSYCRRYSNRHSGQNPGKVQHFIKTLDAPSCAAAGATKKAVRSYTQKFEACDDLSISNSSYWLPVICCTPYMAEGCLPVDAAQHNEQAAETLLITSSLQRLCERHALKK